MVKRIVLLSWLLVSLINTDAFPQSRVEIKNSFYEAESWILFEAYKDALPLYQQLLKKYPDNNNFKYRIGQCYINTPGEKEKSIKYLEDAAKNINPGYKEGKFRETGAPYDVLYYLANAYRINMQLDKALETYYEFRMNLDHEVYDTNIVDVQIQSCLNAKELMKIPVFIKGKNLGNNINGSTSEFSPVVSANEDLLVFAKSEAFYDAIMYSSKINGQWTNPVNINEQVRVDRDLFPTSLSKDGKTLYLYSSNDYDGIIYTSQFENGVWSPIIKLNDNINTKYWESHATISHDNKNLYFTSNRKGTFGGLDIYVSRRDSTGNWGPAVNLGPVINTPFNEESPFLSSDDKTLFFSSRGHFNIGGYDIFSSTMRDNGEWSVPLNVGYPLNSTDDDVFFNPLNEGYEAYIAKEDKDSYGNQDIYRIEIFSDNHPRRFILRGMVKVSDLNVNFTDSVKVSALNIKNPQQILIVYSDPKTGEYEFHLPQGDYQLTYENKGSEKVIRTVSMPLTNPSDSFFIPGTILPKSDFVADLYVESERDIYVTSGDSILFPLKVEPNSTLIVEIWEGDSLVSVEQFFITDSTFDYKMAPKTGKTKVVFKLTDKFNNTNTTEVFITREKVASSHPVMRPEYSNIISAKQIAGFVEILKNRADDNMLKVINGANIEKQQFGKIDDLLSYLKEEASRAGMDREEVDKLALKVAVMDNILTQATVDLLAKYSYGDLQDILKGIDIYQLKLKTWSDLQEYVSITSGGKIGRDELNNLADTILADINPAISLIREKILTYSEYAEKGEVLRQAIFATDKINIKLTEIWLGSFCNESVKQGLSYRELAKMLADISSLPGTGAEQYLKDLIDNSEEPIISSFKLLDLSKEKIKKREDLVLFLLVNKDREKYPEEGVFKSIANLIILKDIHKDVIASQAALDKGKSLWILWLILGSALIIFFFILWKRNKKYNKKE